MDKLRCPSIAQKLCDEMTVCLERETNALPTDDIESNWFHPGKCVCSVSHKVLGKQLQKIASTAFNAKKSHKTPIPSNVAKQKQIAQKGQSVDSLKVARRFPPFLKQQKQQKDYFWEGDYVSKAYVI